MASTLPLDCKEIQPVHSEGDQPWDFFGGNDAEAETPVLWPPHAKSWLSGKDSDAGRDWGQEVKGTTEDEMAGWHHWLNGRESEWTPGVGDGQGGLACCESWGHKESDTTEWLNWTELNSALKLPHFPCYKECRVTGLSFSFCKWRIFIPRTDWWASEFFNVINVSVTLLEYILSFRWIFYSFVTKAFQAIKCILYFLKYLKVQ